MILPHRSENYKPQSIKSHLRSDASSESAESPVLRYPVAALRWAQLVVIVGAGAFAGLGQIGIGLFLLLAAILAQLIILEYRQ